MKKYILVLMALASILSGCATTSDKACAKKNNYDVVAIIWPAYHPEPRWKDIGCFPDGKGEWQNVYEAKPKFEGHNQPIVPLWGYELEDDPIAVARKIDAALASGINVFMYDWYWYEGKPFLEGALNNGFLKAPNNERMKFFLMWANHDVDHLWNNKVGGKKKTERQWSADVSYDEFTKVLVPRFIEYFKKPNYYKVDGKPLFSIFLFNVFVRGMDQNPELAKKAIEYFRAEVKKAGFPDVELIAEYAGTWGKYSLKKENVLISEIVDFYKLDGVFSYNAVFRKDHYSKWPDLAVKEYTRRMNGAKTVFYPVVSTGWDNNPRFPQDEFTSICKGKNPIGYEKNLRLARDWADANIPANKPKMIFINAWNEWTEGEYLEPDKTYGYGYLNATARVFGGSGQATEK